MQKLHSGKMKLMITLNVKKKQNKKNKKNPASPSLYKRQFWEDHRSDQIDPPFPHPVFLGLNKSSFFMRQT